MRFRFIGDYTLGRDSITLCGVTFNGREPSEVTGDEALRRLSSHPEFEAVSFEPAIEVVEQTAIEKPKRGRPRKG